jgi:ribosome biogenesis protein MAK21
MKSVVARDISALILKPINGGPAPTTAGTHVRFDEGPKKSDKAKDAEKTDTINHGRYYGLITLNQITLSTKDAEVAGRLVELYFEVFREVLGEGKQEEEEVVAPEGEMADQVEKVAGKVEKWRGRRKQARPKGGRKTAIQGEQLVETSEARLIAAVLSGINRALPYAKLDEDLSVTPGCCGEN